MNDRQPGRDDASTTTRRRFLRWLGVAGLVAGAAPAAFAAPRAQRSGKPPAGPPARPDTAAAAPARPAPLVPSADALALTAILERRYGTRLTKAQYETIARDLEGDLRAGVRLRDVKLANSDEPDMTFRA